MSPYIIRLITIAFKTYRYGLLAFVAGSYMYKVYEEVRIRMKAEAKRLDNKKEEVEVTEDFIMDLTPKDIKDLLINTFVPKSIRRKIKADISKIKR